MESASKKRFELEERIRIAASYQTQEEGMYGVSHYDRVEKLMIERRRIALAWKQKQHDPEYDRVRMEYEVAIDFLNDKIKQALALP